MQFLAQVNLADSLLLLFQCQNDPGSCQEWSPSSGGNCALVVGLEGLTLTEPPEADEDVEGDFLLDEIDGVELYPYNDSGPDPGYDEAREDVIDTVLGQVGGRPAWVQSDETPTCACGEVMKCQLQLECTGGGYMNFGDSGCGYAFVCPGCQQASFLWQCT